MADRKSTRLNSSHTEIYTLSLHDALPISTLERMRAIYGIGDQKLRSYGDPFLKLTLAHCRDHGRSEEHTSELQSHRDLHSFPTRRSSDLDTGTDACHLRHRRPKAAFVWRSVSEADIGSLSRPW